jgi:hypothetical protein
MLRLILSIIAGLLISAILATVTDHIMHVTGVYPPYGQIYYDTDLFLLASAYRAIYAILGAYVTAVIARKKSRKAVLILGITGAALAIAGLIAMWGMGPAWYPVSLAVLAIPFTLLGEKLYLLGKTRKHAAAL